MKILFIATFPAKHYSLYGEKFLESSETTLDKLNGSCEHLLNMEVAIDGLNQITRKENLTYKSIKLIDYYPSLFGRSDFVKDVSVDDESNLDIAGNVGKQIIRWSFKGMMQIHYLNNHKNLYDFIVYIDADTIFTKELNFSDLCEMLPDRTELLSAVFRHDIKKYTETGWIAWNTQHSYYDRWVKRYTEGWKSHIYQNLNEYHDCAIFDWACEQIPSAKYKNLSGGGLHGFNSGILGQFIDHKKGIRKHLGFSFENFPMLNSKFGILVYKIIFNIYVKMKIFKS